MTAPDFVTSAGPKDLLGWQQLAPLLVGRPYLPFSEGSMRSAALAHVCNRIVLERPIQVVECGSGASTVLLARLLQQQGAGRLVALEHDEFWAGRVNAWLAAEQLDTIAEVVCAPLKDGWYAAGGLPEQIDLLLVDGPPADTPELAEARHPALPRLASRLRPWSVVVLDDIGRAGEQRVLARWEAETDWRFDRLDDEAIAVGQLP